MPNNLTTSENFTNMVIAFEKEVLTGYLDPVGIPTIGIGHVIKPGEPYRVGQKITREESRRLFKKDTAWAVKAVNRLVTRPLNQNQFDALVSLVFNIGEVGFSNSTVLRETNRGNFVAAAKAFALWNKAKGRVLKGLVRRRKAEAELFLRPMEKQPSAKIQTESKEILNESSDDLTGNSLEFEPEDPTTNSQTNAENTQPENESDQATKTLNVPPSDGSTATATKITIAGITVPPSLAAMVQVIQDAVEKGFVDAKTVGDGMVSFLSANYKYVFVGIGILISFLLVKKLFKQITLWLEMYFAASKNHYDVKVIKS
jgi:lysozyme